MIQARRYRDGDDGIKPAPFAMSAAVDDDVVVIADADIDAKVA